MQSSQSSQTLAERGRLAEVLEDVLVPQILGELDLAFNGIDNRFLALLIRRRICRELELLDGHEEPGRAIHSEINRPSGASAYQGAPNPLSDCRESESNDEEGKIVGHNTPMLGSPSAARVALASLVERSISIASSRSGMMRLFAR
jgi:hypothetical protein